MIAVGVLLLLVSAWSVFLSIGAVDPRAAGALGAVGRLAFGAAPPVLIVVALASAAGAGLALRTSRWARDLVAPAGAPSRRWTLAFGALLIGILVHVAQLQAHEWTNLATRRTDFGTFMEASHAWKAGEDAYRAVAGGYFYPPVFAVVLVPFTGLPLGVASTAWLVLKIVLVVDAVRRLRAAFADALATPGARQLFGFLVLAVTARFWLSDLAYGNTNVVTTWLGIVVLTVLRHRPVRAGGALAAATMIKVVPGALALPVLLVGRMRVLRAAVVGLILAAALPFLQGPSHGLQTWDAYVDWGVRAKLGESLAQVDNQSIRGASERLLPDAPTAARGLWIALSLVVVAAAGAVTRRARGSDAEVLALALWPGVLIAVSPGSWVVHYVGGMFPAAALAVRLIAIRWRDRGLVAVFVVLNLAWTVSGWFRPTVEWSTHQSWFLIALLVLLATVARQAWTQTPARVSRRTAP